MKTNKAVLACALTAALPIAVLAPGFASKKRKQPFLGRNFAHRGLHSPDKTIPENSLAAFRLAAEAGYGMELDVQLSKDGYVVVFHDDDLKRVCGIDHRVDELTLSELKELSLCGTQERIPLFVEVLSLVNGRGPLIVELKTGKRNKELCRKTKALLKNYPGEYCIESFDPTIVAWFRFHMPRVIRGQLATGIEEYKMKKPIPFLLSHCLFNPLTRPQFIAYRIGKCPVSAHMIEALGAMRVGWTSHDASSEKGRDAVIFEFYRPERFFK